MSFVLARRAFLAGVGAIWSVGAKAHSLLALDRPRKYAKKGFLLLWSKNYGASIRIAINEQIYSNMGKAILELTGKPTDRYPGLSGLFFLADQIAKDAMVTALNPKIGDMVAVPSSFAGVKIASSVYEQEGPHSQMYGTVEGIEEKRKGYAAYEEFVGKPVKLVHWCERFPQERWERKTS